MSKEKPVDEEFTNDNFEEAEELLHEAINDSDTECQLHHLEIEFGALVERAWESWKEEHKAEMMVFRHHGLDDRAEEMFRGVVYGRFRKNTEFHVDDLAVYEG